MSHSSSHSAVVDQAMEVIEDYQSKILKLEQAVLLKPSMKHVRRRKYFGPREKVYIYRCDLVLQCISSKEISSCTSVHSSLSRLYSMVYAGMMSIVSLP